MTKLDILNQIIRTALFGLEIIATKKVDHAEVAERTINEMHKLSQKLNDAEIQNTNKAES